MTLLLNLNCVTIFSHSIACKKEWDFPLFCIMVKMFERGEILMSNIVAKTEELVKPICEALKLT